MNSIESLKTPSTLTKEPKPLGMLVTVAMLPSTNIDLESALLGVQMTMTDALQSIEENDLELFSSIGVYLRDCYSSNEYKLSKFGVTGFTFLVTNSGLTIYPQYALKEVVKKPALCGLFLD
jgi:hypothetical protein